MRSHPHSAVASSGNPHAAGKSAARNLCGISFVAIALMLFQFCRVSEAAAPQPQNLETGYRQIYNLDFQAAHETFQQWEQLHPEDPLGPVSNAAAYLFEEFSRLKILEVELFADNDRFESRKKQVADADAKKAFEKELARADEIANRTLASAPEDRDAMLSLVFANGLRGDYAAMVEKKNLASLKYMKSSRATAEELLKQHPTCYDAYLAVGVENYLLSLRPALIRWILRLGGAQTDRTTGIEKLRLTAEKGHYLAPYARLLLAVAALRDKDNDTARDLLSGLAGEFPNNDLLRKELERIDHAEVQMNATGSN